MEKTSKVVEKTQTLSEVVAPEKSSAESGLVKKSDVTQTSEPIDVPKIQSVNVNNNVISDVEKPLSNVAQKTSSESTAIPPAVKRESVSPSQSSDDFVEGKMTHYFISNEFSFLVFAVF